MAKSAVVADASTTALLKGLGDIKRRAKMKGTPRGPRSGRGVKKRKVNFPGLMSAMSSSTILG